MGIDTCFLSGLDAYIKTWLQLAFPMYVISLVIVMIVVSKYSPRFAALIGKRDPVATLATLILLSYAKLLSVSINVLSFVTLRYPDGERTVWLSDRNVNYFEGKHVVLAIMALLIIVIIGIPYTILIFLWQWLVRAPKLKAFKWIRSTKLDAFISIHQEPYSRKHRYWPGLLLLVRVVIYLTTSVTVSANPQVSLLITSILVGGLVLIKALIGVRVHKKILVDIIETILLFNLLLLNIFSFYNFKEDTTKQTVVVYISTIIIFILFVGVIGYHLFLMKCSRIRKHSLQNFKQLDYPTESSVYHQYPLTPTRPIRSIFTHSSIELLIAESNDPGTTSEIRGTAGSPEDNDSYDDSITNT